MLEPESVQTCVTSPPYFNLRDYGTPGQIGAEATPEEYVRRLTQVFREVRRVLRPDGTLWINIGDSYASSRKTGDFDRIKPKDLIGIPWMLAFALRADGWYLRQDIIWHKPNCMPESVRDRCTKSHEYIFLLSKSERYCFDAEAIQEKALESSRARYKSAFNCGQKELVAAGGDLFPPTVPVCGSSRAAATSGACGISIRQATGAHILPCSLKNWQNPVFWPDALWAALCWTPSWAAGPQVRWP